MKNKLIILALLVVSLSGCRKKESIYNLDLQHAFVAGAVWDATQTNLRLRGLPAADDVGQAAKVWADHVK